VPTPAPPRSGRRTPIPPPPARRHAPWLGSNP
jgi:hypothetical protein